MTEPDALFGRLPAVVFVNPFAGAATGKVESIRRSFESAQFPVEFVKTESVQDLKPRVHETIRLGHKLLLALGGDGSFHYLINAALEVRSSADLIFGVIPAGGGNDFATAMGLGKSPELTLTAILSGETRRIDLIQAKTADGCARLYAGGGGIGLDAEAIKFSNGKYRHLPGRLRYILSALRALREFSALEVSVEFSNSDAPPMRLNAFVASALNTPIYGAGLRLAPFAQIDDGLLDIAVLEKLTAQEILGILPRLFWNGSIRSPKLIGMQGKSVRFSANRPCLFQGDGEIIGPAPVELEIQPCAIRVVVPAIRKS